MIVKVIKVILAILFFVCLLKMPYGYFQITRLIALVGFAVLAYKANERQDKTEMIIYIGLAILFQPLIKIPLGRHIWNIVDVIVGAFLIITLFWKRKNT